MQQSGGGGGCRRPLRCMLTWFCGLCEWSAVRAVGAVWLSKACRTMSVLGDQAKASPEVRPVRDWAKGLIVRRQSLVS